MLRERAHRVPDVNVGAVRHVEHRGVQVDDVAWGLADVQLRVDALQQRRLAGPRHACAHALDPRDRDLLMGTPSCEQWGDGDAMQGRHGGGAVAYR